MIDLELRVPPVAVALLVGVAMFGIHALVPGAAFVYAGKLVVAAAIAMVGVAIALAGVTEFRRARTTVDPMDPGKSNSVVTRGIYRYSRNPMYLGFLLVLLGWAAYLSVGTFLGPLLFFVYMNRYQIRPEERILRARFGAPYEAFLRTVRRWI